MENLKINLNYFILFEINTIQNPNVRLPVQECIFSIAFVNMVICVCLKYYPFKNAITEHNVRQKLNVSVFDCASVCKIREINLLQ